MTDKPDIVDLVRQHYERHPYPHFPLFASVRQADTYALNLQTLWARFNGERLRVGKILLAGCGSFSPYPFAVANPDVPITALDLSHRNLERARLHCLLHRRTNVTFVRGDLLDPGVATDRYHFIDAFGVIHHLDNPAKGLAALEARLAEGGIIRLMVYGRQARREAQAIRTALRMLDVSDLPTLKKLLRRARPDSRLKNFLENSSEASFDSGLADALLHPSARTFTVDDLLALLAGTSLTPVLFAHRGALPDTAAEIGRLRMLEKKRQADMNFIVYAARNPSGPASITPANELFLNPSLRKTVRSLHLSEPRVPERLGRKNPCLDAGARKFLRKFSKSIMVGNLTEAERAAAARYVDSLFLGTVLPGASGKADSPTSP